MQVELRRRPQEVDAAICERVETDVTAALQSVTTTGNEFIVNDTLWYGRNRQGRVTVQVVNSAGFISRRFENFLHDSGHWDRQKTLVLQTIDAYVEIASPPGYTLACDNFVKFLDQYVADHPESSIDDVFFRYVKRSCFGLRLMDPKYHKFFHPAGIWTTLRVGLEFETGNIASSFRALNKLNYLFRKGAIDAGVFITSKDKRSTAARIWPASNRNGSFEELERRKYRETISFPVWEFSFAPDRVDHEAPYLGVGGQTYRPINTGQVVTIGDKNLEAWTGDGKELLRPLG